jgi:hypothetical protein
MISPIQKPNAVLLKRLMLEDARPMCSIDKYSLWVINPPYKSYMPPMVLYIEEPTRTDKPNCAVIGEEATRYKWLAAQGIWRYTKAQYRILYEVKIHLTSGYSRTISRAMNEYPEEDPIWAIMALGWTTTEWYIQELYRFTDGK